jgi:hypothetical protein
VISLLTSLSYTAKASSEEINFYVYGHYNYCKYWTIYSNNSNTQKLDNMTKAVWISGYMSAINFYTGRENFPDISVITVNDYVTNFCLKNPKGKTNTAIVELITKLKDTKEINE